MDVWSLYFVHGVPELSKNHDVVERRVCHMCRAPATSFIVMQGTCLTIENILYDSFIHKRKPLIIGYAVISKGGGK